MSTGEGASVEGDASSGSGERGPARPGGRPGIPKLLRRTERLQVSVSPRDLADFQRIGAEWEVPASVVMWALACDRLATLRGEALALVGGDLPGMVTARLAEHWAQNGASVAVSVDGDDLAGAAG